MDAIKFYEALRTMQAKHDAETEFLNKQREQFIFDNKLQDVWNDWVCKQACLEMASENFHMHK